MCILVEYIIYTKWSKKNQCKPVNPKVWFRLYNSVKNIDSNALFSWWSSKSICVYRIIIHQMILKSCPYPRLILPPSDPDTINHFFPLSSKSIWYIWLLYTKWFKNHARIPFGTHPQCTDTIHHESKDSNRRLLFLLSNKSLCVF